MNWERFIKENPDRIVSEFGPGAAAPTVETPTEHDEQCRLFQWAKDNEHRHPELALLFAIPNGGHRHIVIAARMKREGVRAGVPDMLLPVARGGFHGLFIELKRADGSNRPTHEQKNWLMELSLCGYAVVVAYGADKAIAALEEYLG